MKFVVADSNSNSHSNSLHVRLLGPIGAKAERFMEHRHRSVEAKTIFYDETVRAIAEHHDDTHDWIDGWLLPDMGAWQGEYWGKNMLSAISAARFANDPADRAWIREKCLELVREYQEEDGYLSSYADRMFLGGKFPKHPGSSDFAWNLWGRKYTMWALVEAAEYTACPELLDAACKLMDQEIAMVDEHHIDLRDTGCFVGLPTMSVLKPLLLLYRATNRAAYLDFARRIVALWNDPAGTCPNLLDNARASDAPVHTWYPKPENWAKAYEMMSCLEGLLEYARIVNEPEITKLVASLRDRLLAYEGNEMGSVGDFDHFIGAAAYNNQSSEPCDIVHWIRVNLDLADDALRASDEAAAARACEIIERAYYNGFLAGVWRDGTWGAHAVRSHGTRHREAPHQVGMKYHQCCIDNMTRTFWDVASHVVTRDASGAYRVNFLSPAHVERDGITIDIGGDYPYADNARITVTAAENATLLVRNGNHYERHEIAAGATTTITVTRGLAVSYTPAPALRKPSTIALEEPLGQRFVVPSENPEMARYLRATPAGTLRYGNVLLAKARIAGTDDAAIFADGVPTDLAAARIDNPDVNLAFNLNGLRVCDYASAADFTGADNQFSIWF